MAGGGDEGYRALKARKYSKRFFDSPAISKKQPRLNIFKWDQKKSLQIFQRQCVYESLRYGSAKIKFHCNHPRTLWDLNNDMEVNKHRNLCRF